MNICISKTIALGLLTGSLLCAMPQTTDPTTFEHSLNAQQLNIWNHIQYERFYIYIVSLVISIAVSRSINAHPWQRVMCMLLLVASLYMIIPKSTYMRYHINKDQDRLLHDVYKQQRLRYHGSIVLALMATPLIC